MQNSGISSGDVQWMTAGSGIIHEEIPNGDEYGRMYGFQLWANIPSVNKMVPPKYRNVNNNQIPEVKLSNDILIKIISGEKDGVKGPVQDIVIDPEYIDVTMPAMSEFKHSTKKGYTVFAYIIEGKGNFGQVIENMPVDMQKDPFADNGTVVLFDDGDEILVTALDKKVRFLLISGKPINEPVAWYGPIVMNSEEELKIAFDEYKQGTFIKYKK